MTIRSSSIYSRLGLAPRTILNGAPVVKSFLGPKEEEEEKGAETITAPEVKPEKSKKKRRDRKIVVFSV